MPRSAVNRKSSFCRKPANGLLASGPSSSGFIAACTAVSVCSVFASLVLYAVFLEFLGFLIASFVLAVFLFAVFASEQYWLAFVKALVLTGLAYVLFDVLLKSNLPRGLLSF